MAGISSKEKEKLDRGMCPICNSSDVEYSIVHVPIDCSSHGKRQIHFHCNKCGASLDFIPPEPREVL